MPARKIFSTSAWKRLSCGTSRKSANQPMESVPASGPGSVTVTSLSVPGVRAGTVAATCSPSGTETPVAATPPIVTVAPETKFVPVITAAVPPEARPDEGAIDETTGALGRGVGVGDGVKVGDGVNVGDGVEAGDGVKVAVTFGVGDGVEVGDGVKVGDSVKVGDGVNVGEGVEVSD